ncbi:MAG TPA: hypothetical protein VK169_04975 [Saprospiraceae bacterium]|nr:hypothetical protein [Saprospiraceae bacterium]
MGTWGPGIFQNDTNADIWVEFKELYNKGLSLKEIRYKLEKEYKPQSDIEYFGEIWTGIAYGQWMCGDVEDYTFKKLNDAIKLKRLTLWVDDKKLLEKRIKAISDFIQKIQTPRPNPLKRKKIVIRHSFFKKGDIIGIKLNPNYYIAAIVTDHQDFENDGENTIAFTDLLFKDQTTLNEVLNSNMLYLDIGGSYKYYRGFYKALFSARNMAKQIDKSIIIDKIDDTEFLLLSVGTPIGDWTKIENIVEEQFNFLKNNKTDRPLNITVKQFLKRDNKLESILTEWDKKIFREKLNQQNSK